MTEQLTRRKWLAGSVGSLVIGVSGCSSDGSSGGNTEDTTTAESTPTDPIISDQLTTVERNGDTQSAVIGEFKNTGSILWLRARVNVKFFNNDEIIEGGEYFTSYLNPGEIWRFYAPARDVSESKITDYSITGTWSTCREFSVDCEVPDGLEIGENQGSMSNGRITINGLLKNTSEEEIERAIARGKIYDSEDRLLGGKRDYISKLGPGESYRFTIQLYSSAASHYLYNEYDHYTVSPAGF